MSVTLGPRRSCARAMCASAPPHPCQHASPRACRSGQPDLCAIRSVWSTSNCTSSARTARPSGVLCTGLPSSHPPVLPTHQNRSAGPAARGLHKKTSVARSPQHCAHPMPPAQLRFRPSQFSGRGCGHAADRALDRGGDREAPLRPHRPRPWMLRASSSALPCVLESSVELRNAVRSVLLPLLFSAIWRCSCLSRDSESAFAQILGRAQVEKITLDTLQVRL